MAYRAWFLALAMFLVPFAQAEEFPDPVPGSASDAPELPDDDSPWTAWNTPIVDDETLGPTDSGWKGTWKLSSATLYAPHGTIQFPSAGHTLQVDYFGRFTLDYSTAYFLASSHVSSNVFTGEHPLTPPAGAIPPGVPEPCVTSAVFSGKIVGQLNAPGTVNPEGTSPAIAPWMRVTLDRAASVKPAVTCEGAEVQVRSTGTIPPLGAGRPTMLPSGPVVEYDYEMTPGLDRLTIRSRNQPKLMYIFVK